MTLDGEEGDLPAHFLALDCNDCYM